MLNKPQKRTLESELTKEIVLSKGGIDTRILVNRVVARLSTIMPLTIYHAFGMISWLLKNNNNLILRSPGHSIIA